MPDSSKLLEVGRDGNNVGFLAMPPHPLLVIRLRCGAIFRLCHPATKAFHARDANYQYLGAGTGAGPLAVAGVEK